MECVCRKQAHLGWIPGSCAYCVTLNKLVKFLKFSWFVLAKVVLIVVFLFHLGL